MFLKHPVKLSCSLAPVTLVLASWLLHGCATASRAPSVIALPNGYYLQRDRNSNIGLIHRQGRQVIRGPIAAYGVTRDIVAGCVGVWVRHSFSYLNDTPFPDSPDCRYFILDTTTGRVQADLDPQAWRARLGQMGAAVSLEITAPVLPK